MSCSKKSHGSSSTSKFAAGRTKEGPWFEIQSNWVKLDVIYNNKKRNSLVFVVCTTNSEASVLVGTKKKQTNKRGHSMECCASRLVES